MDLSSDPQSWSIDQVVQELCYNPSPRWAGLANVNLIPKGEQLEQTLRDNHIDGENLLALDNITLKDDLGIISFGQRRAVLKVITLLQNGSTSYQDMLRMQENVARYQRNLQTPDITTTRHSVLDPSPLLSGSVLQPTIERQDTIRSPSLLLRSTLQPALEQTEEHAHSLVKKPELSPSVNYISLPREDNGHFSLQKSDAHKHPLHPSTNDEDISAPQKPPDQTENTTKHQLDITQHPNTASKPGKRIAPQFVSNIHENAYNANFNESFLGHVAVPMKDTFYGSIDDDGRIFDLGTDYKPNGLRKSLALRMRHYLAESIIRIPNTKLMAKIPYKTRHCHDSQSPHLFTLFGSGALPVIQNLQDWPVLQKISRRQRRKLEPAHHIATSSDPQWESKLVAPAAISSVVGADDLGEFRHLLNKYPAEAEDQGLPLYGDSGDENEYDEDTWEEIEAERHEQQLASTVLTTDETNAAIDEALQELKKEWYTTKLAKVQLKAYRKWMKAARARQRAPDIGNAHFWCNRSDARMATIREAITSEVWRKASDVKAQCRSLEESLSQYLENKYYLEVLQNNQAPPRPHIQDVKASKPRPPELLDGEEIIESETESISDDNFVVSDSMEVSDIPFNEEEDFNPIIPDTDNTISRHALQSAKNSPTREEFQVDTRQSVQQTPPPATPANDADIDSEDIEDRIMSAKDKRKHVGPKQKTPQSQQRRQLVYDLDMEKSASSESSDSDLDAPARLPRSRYRTHGRSLQQPIDLTFSDPPFPEHNEVDNSATSDFDIMTPELNPEPDIKPELGNTPILPLGKNRRQAHEKIPNLTRSISVQESELPKLEDIPGILAVDWTILEDLADRIRVLTKAVYGLEYEIAELLLAYVTKMDERKYAVAEKRLELQKESLRDGLMALSQRNGVIVDKVTGEQSITVNMTLLYTTYVCCRDLMNVDYLAEPDKNESFEKIDAAAGSFFKYLLKSLQHLARYHATVPRKRKGTKRKVSISSAEDESTQETDLELLEVDDTANELSEVPEPPSHKKKKRKIQQSQEALQQQRSGHQRVEEQERRRALMEQRLLTMPSGGDGTLFAINTEEPYVYLDPHIGSRIKPHQVKGVQFMWRELIGDPKYQGCLLAHTMGLGKTMQVISLLVTIAQCNKHKDINIRNHIPQHLRENKTLILCPPSLLDNWVDELLMWTPSGHILGHIQKVSSRKDIYDIQTWSREGGVLVISYDLFRSLLLPRKGSTDSDEDQKQEMEECLLNSPNIIVADEAHKMKNPSSKITQVAQRLRSTSRIALTGSPLNNHLEEYFTMVDWIAPEYLGTIQHFRDNYSQPIIDGLYRDSSKLQRRIALRKLHVLKKDLGPKIDRADISAIEADMPSKTEYFITIPLTDLQRQAYDIYVQYMLEQHRSTGKTSNSRLWVWLAVLSLLCNHPKYFVDKLERQREMMRISELAEDSPAPEADRDIPTSPEEVGALPNDPSLSSTDVTAMESAIAVFSHLKEFDVTQSYRTLIVNEILKKANALGDKTLIFSHSIPTLDGLELMLRNMGLKYLRIDGGTKVSVRQEATKRFNKSDAKYQVFLISTQAGGLGLNLQGANRVIIFDFNFNPMWEEQAIGRAYRFGQRKPVFVYRFRSGGTFEGVVYNKAIFKTQLFHRVVDKKNPKAYAPKQATDYLFPVKDVEKEDFHDCTGKDAGVLDKIIKDTDFIRNIEMTETFQKEDDEVLTEQEIKVADDEYEDARLRREDPEAWQKKLEEKQRKALQEGRSGAGAAWVSSTQAYPTSKPQDPLNPNLNSRSQTYNPTRSDNHLGYHKNAARFLPPGWAQRIMLDTTNPRVEDLAAIFQETEPNLDPQSASFRTSYETPIGDIERPQQQRARSLDTEQQRSLQDGGDDRMDET